MKGTFCRTFLLVASCLICSALTAEDLTPDIDRSMFVVRAWNTLGPANDFHVDLVARDLEGNPLDLADLDPGGYYNSLGGTCVAAFDPATGQIALTWFFPEVFIPYPGPASLFGFTLFGGVRFERVDCYWTYNGVRSQANPDIWQDWFGDGGLLWDSIIPRPQPSPEPPPPPPVSFITRMASGAPDNAPLSIADLAVMPVPPFAQDLGMAPPVPLDHTWTWPSSGTPNYFMFYTLYDMSSAGIMGFRNAARLSQRPTRAAPIVVPQGSDAFPPAQGVYIGTAEIAFGSGPLRLRNLNLKDLSGSAPLPAEAGGAVIPTFAALASFELSTDGGETWSAMSAAPSGLARAALEGGGGGGGSVRAFDTEMLSLELSGGTLPAGLRIRESPTRASRGRVTATAADALYGIDSFFDIYTEISTDDGQTWTPAAGPLPLDFYPPPPVTINRSLNVVRVWTAPGVWANDFHIEFEARDANDLRFLDLDDLDPVGYFDDVFVTNRVVTYNAALNRVSITWFFPLVCLPDPGVPARFGFTVFGGMRFRAVDWYWTLDGERIITYQDVWQDWLKNGMTLRLEDVIMPRPPLPSPPMPPPVPVSYLSRVTGSYAGSVSISDLATTLVPPNPVLPDPAPVVVTNLVPLTYSWLWPGTDPTYYMYYDLLDEMEKPIAGFQNACLVTPVPEAGYVAPVFAETDAFPVPGGDYVAELSTPLTFGEEAEITSLSLAISGPGSELPAPGDAVLREVNALMVFDLGAGGPPEPVRLSVRPILRVADAGGEAGERDCDGEVVSLDCDPDPAHPGLRIRESPSKASLGRTTVRELGGGGYQIDSFFDIYTEISLNDGATWTPADRPARVTLTLPPPPSVVPVTINRSLNTVRVWTPPGIIANDFHIEFVARNSGGFYLSLYDLDPFGYVGSIATNRLVTFDPVTRRIAITWQFADQAVVSNAPAFFGFTVFGGIRYEAVDWYWTLNGIRIWSYWDVWQDWIKWSVNLRDVVAWRPLPVPPPSMLPVPVAAVRRVVGWRPAPLTARDLALMPLPPNPVWPDAGPAAIGPTVTNLWVEWDWPGFDPAYFVYYDLLDDSGGTLAGFRNACILTEKPAPAGETPRFTSTLLFPPPTLAHRHTASPPTLSFGGIPRLRSFSMRALNPPMSLPPPGEARLGFFRSLVTLEVSPDGSVWLPVSLAAATAARIAQTGLTDPFDSELLQLDVSSAALPPGLLVRESPTLASLGRATVAPVAGGFMIDSFFDIFLEISTDGGASWTPADGPMRVAVQDVAAEASAPDNRFAPDDTCYAGREPLFARFGSRASLRSFTHSHFSHACALPPAGVETEHTWHGRADFELNENESPSWTPQWASCRAVLTLRELGAYEFAHVYETRVKELELCGGSMPAGFRLRLLGGGGGGGGCSGGEPYLSAGCTAVRPNPDTGRYWVESFFDVFLELSFDGGSNWMPADTSSGLALISRERHGAVIESFFDIVNRRAVVMFSDRMDPVSVTDPIHYLLGEQPIESLRLLSDGRTVLAELGGTPVPPPLFGVIGVIDAEGGEQQPPGPTLGVAREGLLQTRQQAAMRLTVGQPDGPPETATLTGRSLLLIEVPSTGQAADNDCDGLDDAFVRVLDCDCASRDGRYVLRAGSPLRKGAVEEWLNRTPGLLDMPPFAGGGGSLLLRAFGFTLEVGGLVTTPAAGLDLQGEFTDANAGAGERLTWSAGGGSPVPLLVEPLGIPSGFTLHDLLLMPYVPPVSISMTPGAMQASWPKPSPGLRLQFSTSLAPPDWITLPPEAYQDGGDFWFYPIAPGEEERTFFRLFLIE